MPVTTDIKVLAKDVRKSDLLATAEGAVVIENIKRGQQYVSIFVTGRKSPLVRCLPDQEVAVQRQVKTEEESLLNELASLTDTFRRAVVEAEDPRAKDAAALADNVSKYGWESGIKYAEDGVKHEVFWQLWQQVDRLLSRKADGSDSYATTLVEAVEAVVDQVRKDLVERYSDDTWSGRFRNDVARTRVDAKKDWLREWSVAAFIYAGERARGDR